MGSVGRLPAIAPVQRPGYPTRKREPHHRGPGSWCSPKRGRTTGSKHHPNNTVLSWPPDGSACASVIRTGSPCGCSVSQRRRARASLPPSLGGAAAVQGRGGGWALKFVTFRAGSKGRQAPSVSLQGPRLQASARACSEAWPFPYLHFYWHSRFHQCFQYYWFEVIANILGNLFW